MIKEESMKLKKINEEAAKHNKDQATPPNITPTPPIKKDKPTTEDKKSISPAKVKSMSV